MNKTDDLKLATALLNFLISIESRILVRRLGKQTLKSVIQKKEKLILSESEHNQLPIQ